MRFLHHLDFSTAYRKVQPFGAKNKFLFNITKRTPIMTQIHPVQLLLRHPQSATSAIFSKIKPLGLIRAALKLFAYDYSSTTFTFDEICVLGDAAK